MFQSPGDIAFTFGTVDIHWYGIVMSISILLGLLVIILLKKHFFKDITTDMICDISFLLIIWGILSARMYYVVLDYKYFINHPFEIFAIWNGGISIQGAIFGGIIVGLLYAKYNKINSQNEKNNLKKALENARSILPNACETKIVVTMNARSLLNFFKERCCMRAQDEIRTLAYLMLDEVLDVAPYLFSKSGAPCVYGPCPEGSMSCGQKQKPREKQLLLNKKG